MDGHWLSLGRFDEKVEMIALHKGSSGFLRLERCQERLLQDLDHCGSSKGLNEANTTNTICLMIWKILSNLGSKHCKM